MFNTKKTLSKLLLLITLYTFSVQTVLASQSPVLGLVAQSSIPVAGTDSFTASFEVLQQKLEDLKRARMLSQGAWATAEQSANFMDKAREAYEAYLKYQRATDQLKSLYEQMFGGYLARAKFFEKLTSVKVKDILWIAKHRHICTGDASLCYAEIYSELGSKNPVAVVANIRLATAKGLSTKGSKGKESDKLWETWASQVLESYEDYDWGEWSDYISTEDVEILDDEHKIPISVGVLQKAFDLYQAEIISALGPEYADALEKFVNGEDVASIAFDKMQDYIENSEMYDEFRKQLDEFIQTMLGISDPKLTKKILNFLWEQVRCLILKFVPTFDIYDLFAGKTITLYLPCGAMTIEPDKELFNMVEQYVKKGRHGRKSEFRSIIAKAVDKCLKYQKQHGKLTSTCERFLRKVMNGQSDEVQGQMASLNMEKKSYKDFSKEHAQMVSAIAEPPVNLDAGDSVPPYQFQVDGMTMMLGLKAAGEPQMLLPGKEFVTNVAHDLRPYYAKVAAAQGARKVYLLGKIERIKSYRKQLAHLSQLTGSECSSGVFEWCDTIDEYFPGTPPFWVKPLCSEYLAYTYMLDPTKIFGGIPPLGVDLIPPAWIINLVLGAAGAAAKNESGSKDKMYAAVVKDLVDKLKKASFSDRVADAKAIAMLAEGARKQERVFASMVCKVESNEIEGSNGQQAVAKIHIGGDNAYAGYTNGIARLAFLSGDSVLNCCRAQSCIGECRRCKQKVGVSTKGCCGCTTACVHAGATCAEAATGAVAHAQGAITLTMMSLHAELHAFLYMLNLALANFIGYELCLTRWVIRNEFRWLKKWWSAQVCVELSLLEHQIAVQLDILETDTFILASLYANKTYREVRDWQNLLKAYESQGLNPYCFGGNCKPASASEDTLTPFGKDLLPASYNN